MFNRHGGRGVLQSVEDKNAYNVVMEAVNGRDMKLEKLLWYLYKKLAVSHHQIKKRRLLQRDMEDMDKKGGICVNGKVTSNSIEEGNILWVCKYDILLCILFTSQSHIHVLVYLLHYIYSLYFINRALGDNSRGPAY